MISPVDPNGPLGVLAEGWEGLRAAELLRRRLPLEDVHVVADQSFAPYARRRPEAMNAHVAELVALLDLQGAKAILLASAVLSFEARPLEQGQPVRGLETGLRDALEQAAGRPIVAVIDSTELRPVMLAKTIRRLRGGGSVTLVERGSDHGPALVARARIAAPEVAIVVLVTPAAFCDVVTIREAAEGIVVIDALDSAARHLVHDVRLRRLIAHRRRPGRVVPIAIRPSPGTSSAGLAGYAAARRPA